MRLVGSLIAIVLYGCGGEAFTPDLFAGEDGGVDATQSDSEPRSTGGAPPTGTGGATTEDDAGEGDAGGAPTGAGGAVTQDDAGSTGGVGSGGAPAAGGAPSTGGHAPGTGGASTGGTVACTKVAHDNGIGQSWEDCVELGTYSKAQAMKACDASDATQCTDSQSCGGGNFVVIGRDTASNIIGAWGYGGAVESFVCSGATCSGCPTGGSTWK